MSRLAALALAAALVLGLVGCDTSSIVPGGSGDVMPNPAASQTGTTPSDGQDAAFQMHFIDVGQALSVLVECDGQFMLYDGGNVDDGSLVVSYLQNQGVEQLEYVFCSHAHEDHVGGLAAALAYFPAYHVYSPVTEASTKCFKDFVKYTAELTGRSTCRRHPVGAGQRHRYPAGPGNAVQRDQQHLAGAAHRLRRHQLSADRRHGKYRRD